MGLFGGGEKHTRESITRAAQEAERAEAGEAFAYGSPDSAILYPGMSARADEARAKLEKLYGAGENEAHKLNEEYDRLLGQARDALNALAQFEKEKLGMEGETGLQDLRKAA